MNQISVQCRLTKGSTEQIVWLPSKFAVEGHFVKLKDKKTGSWDDGWKVEQTYTRLETKYVHDILSHQNIHKPSENIANIGHK